MNISKQRISKILFSRCLGGFANGFKTSLMKKLLILSLTTLSFFVFNNVYAAVNFHARVSPSWQELFGLGYNPNHFYNKTVPSPTGDNYDAFNDNDSLAVPIDLPAMQKAGFNSVRIYGGSPLTVIRMIRQAGIFEKPYRSWRVSPTALIQAQRLPFIPLLNIFSFHTTITLTVF